ncbi:MAG TPA: YciI family protein [Micrococcaceae bacterium]|jgi:hypothetical protein|nr:YciI family protein [Micrococcaceae bacterium]
MKYMLIIYGNTEVAEALDNDLSEELARAHQAIQKELLSTGELIGANELSTVDAKVVRTSGEGTVVTDGPFMETKEWVAGYYLVECEGLDRAVEIAGRFFEAKFVPVEVRQIGVQ